MEKLTLLYVDDEEINLTSFKVAFRHRFDIHTALSGEEALALLKQLDDVAMVVADQRMPGMSGTELLQEISRIYPDTVRIMLTAFSDPPDIIDAINKGEVYSYLRKPWEETTLVINLDKAAEKYHLQQQNKKLIRELSEKNQALEKELHVGQKLREALIRRDMILAAVNDTAQKLIRYREWRPFTKPLIARLGVVMAASRVHIYRNYHDIEGNLRTRSEFSWISENGGHDDKLAIAHDFDYKEIDLERWPLLFESGTMIATTIDDMPNKEANRLQRIDIQSIACSPINIKNRSWGFLCLVDCQSKRTWHEEELEAIKAAASLIGEAVHREEIEQDLTLKQDQLAHAGRLNAIGEMAEGVAYEIDESMSIISLEADKFKEYFSKNAPEMKEMEAAQDIVRQVSKTMRMIEDMRSFASFSDKHFSETNLYWPTTKALSFFREQFRLYLITLDEDLSEEIPFIKSDSQLYGQIVVNLLSNARYAVRKMAEKTSGHKMRIQIRLYEEPVTSAWKNKLPTETPFDKVSSLIILEVVDNGIGMSEETKHRCIDPFFSTKPSGQGTGLGLSVTNSLVKELGFVLEIESTPDSGSTFRILIPAYEEYPTLLDNNIVIA